MLGRASQESVLNDKEIILTRDGLKKLEDELDELKSVHRREVNERIRQAKEFGDISENAEYEDAKQEQAFVEGRVLKLESMIRNARIIDASDFVADARPSWRDGQGKRTRIGPFARVHHRRFGRSRSEERAALERIAGRRRADGPQERRDGRRHDAARRDEVQDRSDQQSNEESGEESFLASH